jgi:hypothetical protein
MSGKPAKYRGRDCYRRDNRGLNRRNRYSNEGLMTMNRRVSHLLHQVRVARSKLGHIDLDGPGADAQLTEVENLDDEIMAQMILMGVADAGLPKTKKPVFVERRRNGRRSRGEPA